MTNQDEPPRGGPPLLLDIVLICLGLAVAIGVACWFTTHGA